MDEMISAFPAFAPGIIVIGGLAWLVKQCTDIALSFPKRAGGRSLRRLRLAKETADLAAPDTPEHQLLVGQQRDAAIEHAVSGYAPPQTWGWITLAVLLVAGVTPALLSPDPVALVATSITSALVGLTQFIMEKHSWRQRSLIRRYCFDNPQGKDIENLLESMKSEMRSQVPARLVKLVDDRTAKLRSELRGIEARSTNAAADQAGQARDLSGNATEVNPVGV